jgi:hypothetical protein
MLSLAEIVGSLRAVVGIVLGRPGAIKGLDVSYDGFWRSFLVIVPMAPLLALGFFSQQKAIVEQSALTADLLPTGQLVFVYLLLILVDLVAFPLALALLGRTLGISARFVPYVVALNWLSLAVALPVGFVQLLHVAGIIAFPTAFDLQFVLMLGALGLQYVVTRAVVGTPIPFSIGLVVFNLFLSLAAQSAIGRLFGF